LVKGDLNLAKDIQAFLRPLLNLAKKHNIAILLVWHLNKRETKDPFKAILGSSVLSAVVKRVLVLEKQEDKKTIVHFRKTTNTEPVAFIVDESTFEWIKEKIDEEFGSHISKGKEIADLILEALNDAKEKGLSYNQILKVVEPYGITKENLKKIFQRYLRGKIRKERTRDKNGTFKEWRYFLTSRTNLKCLSGENVEKSSTPSRGTHSYSLGIEKIEPPQSLEKSKIEEGEISDTPKNKKVSQWIKSRNEEGFIQRDTFKTVPLDKNEKNQEFDKFYIFKGWKENKEPIVCACGCDDLKSYENPKQLIRSDNSVIVECVNCGKRLSVRLSRIQVIVFLDNPLSEQMIDWDLEK